MKYSLENFAYNLKICRTKWGLKQEDFSKLFNFLKKQKSKRANVSNWETLRYEPPFEFVFEFSEMCGVPIELLMSAKLPAEYFSNKPWEPTSQEFFVANEPATSYGKGETGSPTLELIIRMINKIEQDQAVIKKELGKMKSQ